MFTKPNSSSNFGLEIENFNESNDLSSIFELFAELSELTQTKNWREGNHQLVSKQNRAGSTISIQKKREETISQSCINLSKNCCNPISEITRDAIQIHILKCSRDVMNDFYFADYVDMIDVREHQHHDESFSDCSDDESSVETESSYQTVDSIVKSRLPHLCHHSRCNT
jgi:hypothetical protein